MLALLGAMREEIADLQRQMVVEESYNEQGYRIYKGKYGNRDVLLAQTGMGKKKAERTAEFILDHYPVSTLVSLGFSGALVEGLDVGDVALCTNLYCEDKKNMSGLNLWDLSYSDKDLVSKVVNSQDADVARFLQANSVTVASPVCEPEAKILLGQTFSAEVVDMESYWIARMASDSGVPFISIRVISDTVQDRLPPFDRFYDSSGLKPGKAVLYFFIHPWQLLRLFYFNRNAGRARKKLSLFMDSVITEL